MLLKGIIMRKFKIYKGRLVRVSQGVDKITMLDWLLHLFKIHVIRQNYNGITYCRLCNSIIK